MFRLFKFAAAVSVIVMLVAACAGKSEDPLSQVQDTEDIKKMVNDYSVGHIRNQSASITSRQLIVLEGEKKSTFDLPEEEFFVSIAPYVNVTHPCMNHSLTGCQGEMVEEEFNVYIEDTEGKVMLDQKLKSLANGFIDLWLPRNQTYHITIENNGKRVEAEFSTFDSDGTCITTMQLT